jgi:hypothetical protein
MACRRITGNLRFKRGTLFRHALDGLRNARAPVNEIAKAMLAAKGVEAAPKRFAGIKAGCGVAGKPPGKTVEPANEGVPKRWRLKV